MKKTFLLQGVKKFRDALMQSNAYPEFPNGCAKFSSFMLAKFLHEEMGIDKQNISYVFTGNSDSYNEEPFKIQTHGWLIVKGINVDITGYQFPEISNEIVVRKTWYWGRKFVKRVTKFQYNEIELANEIHLKNYNKIIELISNDYRTL